MSHFNEVDRMCDVVRPEDETAGEEIRVPDKEVSTGADGVQVGAVGTVREERIVVAIDEDESFGHDERLHGKGFARGDANYDKTLPGAPRAGGPGAKGLKSSRGQMHESLDGGGADYGLEERGGVGDKRNASGEAVRWQGRGVRDGRQQVGGSEALRCEDAVHGFEGELAPAVQKVGEMSLPQPGLAGEQRNAECAPLYPAQ